MFKQTWTHGGGDVQKRATDSSIANGAGTDDGIVGTSPSTCRLMELVRDVAGTDVTVLVRGESGVGKELVAHAIRRRSKRASQPYVIVDCASLHENLLQSELFGHEAGAYTGAIRQKHGLFETANRGTILLDEIAELSPALQVKLLRVLESGTFRRLGGLADIHVDVRVIAATNRALEAMLAEHQFREDLYYRLNVFPIDVPPLREHREDVPALVEHFINLHTQPDSRPANVSAHAMALLAAYAWPGNVRELGHVIERALILCQHTTIESRHLPSHIQLANAIVGAERERPVALRDVERQHIARVLEDCKGHRERAAKLLRISSRTLYRRLKSHAP